MSDSYPRQQARTRRFTLGAPRTFTVSPDGERVLFLRSGGGDDPVNRLWELDIDRGRTRIVVDPTALAVSGDELPAAERARRERLRETGGGITAYACDRDLRSAVFTLGATLFRTDLPTGETVAVDAAEPAFDPRLDADGSTIVYVSGRSLRIIDQSGDRELIAEPDPTVSWGSAEFVAAEEMGRSRGFWWDPGGGSVLAARVDVAEVTPWHIAAPVEPARPPVEIRYPAAGTANAEVRLAVVGFDGRRVDVAWDHERFEYLVGVRWDRGHPPLVVLAPRDQRRLWIGTVDVSSGTTHELVAWDDDTWVEPVPGMPAWAGDSLVTVRDHDGARRLFVDERPVTPGGLQLRSVVHTDEDGSIVTATSDPTVQHVWVVPHDGGPPVPLTEGGGIHGAVGNSESLVVTTASMAHDGTRVELFRAGAKVADIDSLAETPVLVPKVNFQVVADRALHAAVLFPSTGSEGPLPVLLDPYGGPHALRVQNARAAFGASQWLADQGFVVVVTDGRGTPARGPEWERAVHGDLAGPVLEDQVDALLALAAADERFDLGRVAIRGWSFGGYLAALAVLRRPDVFAAAIAGAPVTDWRLYDTFYTERYLGHPEHDIANYERTNLIAEAAELRRPLLLIHGLADDNVVVAHTLQLSRALLEAGRPHEVLPLSDATHMTPQEAVAENLLRLQVDFLQRALC